MNEGKRERRRKEAEVLTKSKTPHAIHKLSVRVQGGGERGRPRGRSLRWCTDPNRRWTTATDARRTEKGVGKGGTRTGGRGNGRGGRRGREKGQTDVAERATGRGEEVREDSGNVGETGRKGHGGMKTNTMLRCSWLLLVEVLHPRLLACRLSAFGHFLEDLQSSVHVLVKDQDACNVATAVAVVRCTPYRDEILVRKHILVPFLHQLMRTCHQFQSIGVVELRGHFRTEQPTGTTLGHRPFLIGVHSAKKNKQKKMKEWR